ncbi:MAG: hypothetical protein ACT4QG_14485 [Sporichthyaceae bacterium]
MKGRQLRRVMVIDAWVSFYSPVLLFAAVPILYFFEVSATAIFVVVVVLALILGGCGLLMAGLLAFAMGRDGGKFPDDPYAYFHLDRPTGTKGWHVPY